MLLRKMLRDMRAGRAQFVSIFLMAFLGVFVYAGINAEWYGMEREIDRYYEAAQFPDFWAVGEDFTAGDGTRAAAVPGVQAVQRRLTLDATAKLEGSPVVRVGVLDENRLSTPLLVDGEPLDLSMDGLWLDEAFAQAHGLAPGDLLTLTAFDISLTKPVLGLVMHPEFVYSVKDDTSFTPDPAAFGFAFVPRAALPMSGLLPYNQLLVKLDGSAPMKVVKPALEDALEGRYSVLLTRSTLASPAQFQNEIDQNRAMGGVFPVVFFLIASLTMLTTMTRLTGSQRLQIGTLKALGFPRRSVLNHYVSYGLWLGLFGGLIGLVAGPLIIPPILYTMQMSIYRLPQWRAAWSLSDFAAVAVAVACCGASSYFACRRELRDAPAATLRPRAPKAARHTRLEKSRLWRALGFNTQWNLRDLLRSPMRSAMAVLGVTGCMALFLLGLGLNDSVNGVSDLMYEDLFRFQSKISLREDITAPQLSVVIDRYPGQLLQEGGIELQAGGLEKTGSLTVVSPGDQILFEGSGGQNLPLPEHGAALSAKMAQLLGVREGDKVRWRVYGEAQWRETAVEAVYRSPIGQGIAFSEGAWLAIGETMKPTALLTGRDASEASELPGVGGVQDRDALKRSFTAILENMQTIIGILILAAVLLGAVVLYNLGSLSFTERTRELATLKVLGFPRRKIRKLLETQNLWLTVLGVAMGIPAGYAFLGFLLSTISESSDFPAFVSRATLTVSVAATFLLSLATNRVLSRNIKTLDMIGSLKSVE